MNPIKAIYNGFCTMLRPGGPSSTRFINIIVAFTGAWLLYYGAKSGEVSGPWAACFLGYLAYGAGAHVLSKYLAKDTK